MNNQQEQQDGNKLIAEFMGATIHPAKDYYDKAIEIASFVNGTNLKNNHDVTHPVDCLCYHESWDDLMPVVEKIENNGIFSIRGNYVHVVFTDRTTEYFLGKSKIDAVYQAVIGFINWYNTQKP